MPVAGSVKGAVTCADVRVRRVEKVRPMVEAVGVIMMAVVCDGGCL